MIKLEGFAHRMKGIAAENSGEYLNEGPQVYKDLDTIIHNQTDLVEPVRRLMPLMNVAGASHVKKDRRCDRNDPLQQRKEERRKQRR